MPQLTNHNVFEYKICYHVALRANATFCHIATTQNFTLIDLLLNLPSPTSIFFTIQIKYNLK